MKMCRFLASIMLLLFTFMSVCLANDTFQNNPDYKMVSDDKKSVEVKKYEPPIYEIDFCTSVNSRSNQISKPGMEYMFRCNYDTKQVWFLGKDYKWHEYNVFHPNGSTIKKLINEGFKVAYGIPFYKEVEDSCISLGGISPRDNMYKVRKKYGEPSYSKDMPTGVKFCFYEKEGIGFFFEDDGEIITIITHLRNTKTSEGIGVGSNIYEILAKYGEICEVNEKPNGKAVCQYSSPGGGSIEFHLENGIVSAIFLSWY